MMRKNVYEKTVTELGELVNEWGQAKVYLVGGCVRNSIRGVGVKDIDIMVDLENGSQIFSEWLKDKQKVRNLVTFPRFGTIKFDLLINGKDIPIECVSRRGANLEEDAKLRDFCCNALYEEVRERKVIDPTGYGRKDIEEEILRTPIPAEQTFRADPIRMLRAFRFKAENKFNIHPDVYSYLKPYPEYLTVSLERVRGEFGRIIQTRQASSIIRELHNTGLLGYIIPEFEEAWGFNQNSHYHSMNLTDHSLQVLNEIHSGDERVRMAALLHDISKYRVWKIKKSGEFSFAGHEIESGKMAREIMKRLKYSEEDIRLTVKIIEEHMILKSFKDPITGKYNGSLKITRKIIRRLGEELNYCLDLINADNISHASQYNMPVQVPSFFNIMREVDKIQVIKSCPISGNLIMETFKIEPGPQIGEIKDIFLDWLDENPEFTKEELMEKYKSEFEGKEFWVHSEGTFDDYIFLTLAEPFDSSGHSTFAKTSPHEIPFGIEKGNIKLVHWKEKKRAVEYPKQYRAMMKVKKAREIFNEAANILAKLQKIPGFKDVVMNLDSENDLCGKIDWTDLRPEHII